MTDTALHTTLDVSAHQPDEVYRILMSIIVPRPVAWVSTCSADGVNNLAPYGWFGAVSGQPPIVHFTSRAPKDSWRNANETGSFVINIADAPLRQALMVTSQDVPAQVDESELAGVTLIQSDEVSAPRVQEAPISLECVTHSTHPIGESIMTFGTVVRMHIRPDILGADGLVDAEALNPLAKLGGTGWSSVAPLQ
ncbi:flavin reductase family protein [Actinomyces vulturis]|uniref:flavin reductase family protein n=1 Tax=Actinomyces vulturis TaxID=1857645 RepID=UPI00082F9DED|nr:flavin reductase family protein [Actinomyces vulturis]